MLAILVIASIGYVLAAIFHFVWFMAMASSSPTSYRGVSLFVRCLWFALVWPYCHLHDWLFLRNR